MERNSKTKLAAAVTALFLLGSACASVESGTSSRSVITPKIDLTVTGSADHQLFNQIARDLQDEARKLPQADMGEFAADLQKSSPPEIVMSQFKKTAEDIPYADTKNKAQQLDIVYPFVWGGSL